MVEGGWRGGRGRVEEGEVGWMGSRVDRGEVTIRVRVN